VGMDVVLGAAGLAVPGAGGDWVGDVSAHSSSLWIGRWLGTRVRDSGFIDHGVCGGESCVCVESRGESVSDLVVVLDVLVT
jgi:hypothetical protein